MDSIISYLNSAGKTFIDFALPMLIQSSVLILILLGLDLILRRKVRAVFRYCVWLLVLVKLVLPTTLSAPTGLGYWLGGQFGNMGVERPSLGRTIEPSPSILELPKAPGNVLGAFHCVWNGIIGASQSPGRRLHEEQKRRVLRQKHGSG